MVEALVAIYLFYIFIALYFLFFFLLIYIPNRRYFFEIPKPNKNYSLSIVVPCYNEEKNIEGTVKALLESDYEGLKKVIVVDDNSKDNSYEIIKRLSREYDKVISVQTPKNTGKASGAKNYGARFADTELIGFTDADSSPKKEAIKNMIGFFNDEKVGAVTSSVLVEKRSKLIEKLQSIEYKIIVFTRRLLGFVDAIYVTPGPLAIYRKSAFDEINRFDENNLTEDIEITWHLVAEGYKVRMSPSSKVYTIAPDTFKQWFNQRVRWNLGGIQTILKYKNTFLKKGMLGYFILPFFVFSWILGITGLFILFYRLINTIVVRFFSASYSIQNQAAIITFRELNLVPSVLIFFGITIITLSLFFTFFALSFSKEREFKKHGIFNILIYMFIYLLAYPLILMVSVFKYIKKQRNW